MHVRYIFGIEEKNKMLNWLLCILQILRFQIKYGKISFLTILQFQVRILFCYSGIRHLNKLNYLIAFLFYKFLISLACNDYISILVKGRIFLAI